MRGRKPKPAALKKLSGQKSVGSEPQFGDAEVKPPSHLSALERRYWRQLTKITTKAGLLTAGDHYMLSLCCNALAIAQKASVQLAKEELTVTLSNGVVAANPLIGILNKARADAAKLLAEFGLSPSARQRVLMDTTDEDDPFGAFLAEMAEHDLAEQQKRAQAAQGNKA